MCEGSSRRRVRDIVGRNIYCLDGSDGSVPGGGDPLLKLTDLVGKRGLVTNGGRDTSKKSRNLGTCLDKSVYIINEKENILLLLVS